MSQQLYHLSNLSKTTQRWVLEASPSDTEAGYLWSRMYSIAKRASHAGAKEYQIANALYDGIVSAGFINPQPVASNNKERKQ